MSNDEANSSRNDDFHLPSIPSDDWQMNVFLNELADELTDEDLKKMKHLMTGLNGTGKAVLEQIKDPLDLFQHLRQRCILNRDNIIMLQAMLWQTKRKDLHNKFVKFAKKRGNIIHFFQATEKPENGFEYIKFHIGGKEKMDRHELEKLRLLVSYVLCIPTEFVIAAGIEATNSIHVIFMVPVGYADIIFDLDNEDRGYLGSEGVDAIWYDGKTINCSEFTCILQDESIKTDDEVIMFMDQKSKLEKEVENLQIHGLQLSKILRQSEEKFDILQMETEKRVTAVTASLIQEYVGLKYTPENLSLQSLALKNSLKWFNLILQKMQSLNYDTELIRDLLEANATVTRLRIRTNHAWIESNQKHQIDQLQEEMEVLKYERAKLAFFLKVGISEPVLTENEEFFVHIMSSLLLTYFANKTEVSLSLERINADTEVLKQVLSKIFKEFEDTLKESEKELLIVKHLSSPEEQKKYKESNLRLLEYLWLDFAKKNGNDQADFQKWMLLILASIKRIDLYDQWTKKGDLLIKAYLVDSATDDKHTNDYQESQQKAEPSTKHGNSRGKKVKRNRQTPPIARDCPDEKLSTEERLQRMEKIMEKVVYRQSLEDSCFLEKASQKANYDFSKILQSKLMK